MLVLSKDSMFGRPDGISDFYPCLVPATLFSASVLIWASLQLLSEKNNLELK